MISIDRTVEERNLYKKALNERNDMPLGGMRIQDLRPSLKSKSCQVQNSSTIKSYQNLTVFYTNADNLINKRNELYHSIASVKPEIICITEILPKNASLPVDDWELRITC